MNDSSTLTADVVAEQPNLPLYHDHPTRYHRCRLSDPPFRICDQGTSHLIAG